MRSCASTCLQVVKQQEAQRRAAEVARERLKKRGRDNVYDFRFTRFHETGLEQQTVPELPNDNPSLADSAEMRARSAASTSTNFGGRFCRKSPHAARGSVNAWGVQVSVQH